VHLENSRFSHELQHQNSIAPENAAEVKRRRLELTRDSTFEVANAAAIHLEIILQCLQVADDDALVHYTGRAVEAMRSVAKLTNEVSSIRNGGIDVR
jgi:hypothetical protein